jgi:hypothetical protein
MMMKLGRPLTPDEVRWANDIAGVVARTPVSITGDAAREIAGQTVSTLMMHFCQQSCRF